MFYLHARSYPHLAITSIPLGVGDLLDTAALLCLLQCVKVSYFCRREVCRLSETCSVSGDIQNINLCNSPMHFYQSCHVTSCSTNPIVYINVFKIWQLSSQFFSFFFLFSFFLKKNVTQITESENTAWFLKDPSVCFLNLCPDRTLSAVPSFQCDWSCSTGKLRTDTNNPSNDIK